MTGTNEIKETTWPIYRFVVRWTYSKPTIDEYDDRHGLPEGREWNGTSWEKMFKEEQTRNQLDAILMDFWSKYEKKGESPELFSLHAEFLRNDTWCLTWFSHYTFDVGQSDADALMSFEHYVYRKESEARKKGEEPSLMGAEDRWRWSGARDEGGDTSPPPCRCEGCKKLGYIRIDH